MSNELNQDIDSLLDGTLDDLADMPEFKPFPVGAHKVQLNMELKEINKSKAMEITLKYIEPVELTDPTAVPPNVGDTTNVLYFLTHSNPKAAEIGQGQFKEMMKAFAEHFGAKSNRELIAEANGCTAMVVTGLREEKKDGKKTGKAFTEIQAVQVV